MEGSEQSSNDCYSTDQEYFIDLCRGGQSQQIQQFLLTLGKQSKFNWQWTTNSSDNFVHMLSGNNFPQIFVNLMNVLKQKQISDIIPKIINHQNSTGNTPLHYAVITDSKQMVIKLLQFEADTSIINQFGRTAFDEAAQFDKNQIAEILAPVTKQDIEKLKQQFGTLDICNEDSSQQEQQSQTKLNKLQTETKNQQKFENKQTQTKSNQINNQAVGKKEQSQENVNQTKKQQ